MKKFAKGDYVRFGHPAGSIGQVESIHPQGHRIYVLWVYGRDVAGNVMSATSGCDPLELEPITEAEYIERRDRKGFGGQTQEWDDAERLQTQPPGARVRVKKPDHAGIWVKVDPAGYNQMESVWCHTDTGALRHFSWLVDNIHAVEYL